MFEIENIKSEKDTKEFLFYIMMHTKDVRFKLIRKKDFSYKMKVYTKTHILDIIKYLEQMADIKGQHKITFKIDGIKHYYYIGLPY